MKRTFYADEEISPCILDRYPQLKDALQRIHDAEETIEEAIRRKKRFGLALNAEPEAKTKILRVFVRSQHNPSTSDERAHFIITIEGHLLDKSAARSLPFGEFFEKVRVQLDRRFYPVNYNFEWSADTLTEGIQAHCFRIKAYGDKPFTAKIFLHRAADVKPRFELSPQLRSLLPCLPTDPTEDDALIALQQYIQSRNLIDERKLIRCNQV
jgi:hypothetical protein